MTPLYLIVAFWLGGFGLQEPAKPAAPRPAAGDEGPSTAEDILRALQRQRPPNDVLPPGSAVAGGVDWKKPKPRIWPEGFSLVEKTGVPEKRADDWWFRFEFPEGDTVEAMQLLPNTHLETMIRMSTTAGSPMRFQVSGEMTVFEGRNFLLIRSVARAAPPNAATDSSAPRVRGDAASTDVMDVLRSQMPSTAQPPGETLEPLAAGGSVQSDRLAPEGSPVVRRVGRLVRQGEGWLLVSDSQRESAAEPPVAVLPNQVSETMIRETHKGATPLVFIVSGETTVYFGSNYLLPRVATRRVDLGNLRP